MTLKLRIAMLHGRIVDLSHKLFPDKEEYHLRLKTHFTDELYPQYHRDADVWYILQDVEMSSHCGTHVEFPYHHNRQGLDAGNFPLDRLIGDAVLLDFTHKQPGETVTLEELRGREDKVHVARHGAIQFPLLPILPHRAIARSAADRPRRHPLAGRGEADQPHRIGRVGIELKGVPNQPNHQFLMDHQVPIIEFAANLDGCGKNDLLCWCWPCRWRGWTPVRCG